MDYLALILSFVFIVLGVLHFNWALGGKFGFNASLPTNEGGKRVLNPKKRDSAIVGLGLVLFGTYYLINADWLSVNISEELMYYIGWVIPGIFMLRTIGDFRYVGIFKKVKGTPFAKSDNRIYIPLCFGISVLGFLIQFNS